MGPEIADFSQAPGRCRCCQSWTALCSESVKEGSANIKVLQGGCRVMGRGPSGASDLPRGAQLSSPAPPVSRNVPRQAPCL